MRNEILLRKKWQFTVVVLIFMTLLPIILLAISPTITAHASDDIAVENALQRRIPTLNDDFDDSKVIVVLNQKDSKYNGKVRLEDFKIIDF